jgi:hypothetical protein
MPEYQSNQKQGLEMEGSIHSREIAALRMTGGLVLFFFFLSGAVGLIYENHRS